MTCVIIIIGSKQNGTVREAKMLAAMNIRLYFCTC